jgi:hypothetical protein
MKNSFRVYGVKEPNTLTSEIDRSVEEITLNGFTIVDEVLSPTQIQEAASRLETIYDLQVSEIGGAENLSRINYELIARCLLAYYDYFLAAAAYAKIV